ncbi:N-(5'-phosphoribosyl)anthranilate isomerase [alpha proteobacterium AAP81b]|nr:N-(5'-phosphoribosyl)anthranilate isomerase [alpha proteobacterium AAP81b]
MTDLKICGLSTPETVDAALAAGARYLGFVFFKASPRDLTPERAQALAARVPAGIGRVAVLVDPDDALVDAVLAAGMDILQLHGREDPARLAAIKARTGAKVWRAAGVATRDDIRAAVIGRGPADLLLLDAKPPKAAALPGGNGVAFDWRLLAGADMPRPWGLSGGLTAATVGEAVALVRPDLVDVSSGVEETPGVKSIDKIRAFARAALA